MDARVIVLRDVNGAAVKTLDVSDLPNDNAAAPYASRSTMTRASMMVFPLSGGARPGPGRVVPVEDHAK